MNLIQRYKELCQKQADELSQLSDIIASKQNNIYNIPNTFATLTVSDNDTLSWINTGISLDTIPTITLSSAIDTYEERISALENQIEELLRRQTMNHEPDN